MGLSICTSQSLVVDDTYSAPSLVDLLINDPCFDITNITMSSGQSVAYFNSNSSTFPLAEGVLIRNGQASLTAGQYTGNNLSSPLNNDTDTFLQNLSTQSSGQSTSLVDIAYLEFDFTTSFNSFSFNFLFASNEYGEFQCISNDIFAFALTDLVSGTTTNLAVIPGSTNPVTVKNIRNTAYNSDCNSSNPGYFSTYNVTNPAVSTLNMRGHTVVLSAGSAIIPDHPYRIRLSIGDYGDADYDSAVFISSGSFTTDFDLGDDQILCDGDTYILDTQLDNSYSFQWLQDGTTIAGETASTYTVTSPGTYTVLIDKNDCHIEDSVIFTDLAVTSPLDLYACDTANATEAFDLTQNNETILGIDDALYDVYYYTSIANANSDNPIDTSVLASFMSSGQTIYIKIFNTTTAQFCNTIYEFDLVITDSVTAGTPSNPEICASQNGITYDLTNHDSEIINGQTGSYTLSYYTSQNDAIAGTNAIDATVSIPTGTTSATYWIRIIDNDNPDCFDVTSITITINPQPLIDSIDDIIECSQTTLPVITNGSYYTGSNGTGTNLGQGGATPIIDEQGTYYIFNGPDANGCTNESSFSIILIDQYSPPIDNCGRFVVPVPPENIGDFYTAAGGPNGSGSIINPGTVYNNTTSNTIIQTIYYYAEINGVVCRDEQYDIYIYPFPPIDTPADVVYCDSYTLPALTNGNYFTELNAGGTALFEGDVITSTQTIYVYNESTHTTSTGEIGTCSYNHPFIVNIIDTTQFTSSTNCGSFTLPSISIGSYYDQPNGQGNSIDPSIPITTSQVVYYYADTTELPNCTDNLNYNITIIPLPLVDEIPSADYCEEYVLPQLTNGTYYLLSGGPDTTNQVEIQPNTVIDLSGTSLPPGTYYVYNGPDASGCTNEWSFTIGINPNPTTDEVLNSIQCNAYSIPTPTNGTIYTEAGGPNGTGTVVSSSDVFNEDNTFYIYNEDLTTGCVVDNPFTVFYNGINLPDYLDVAVCAEENYQLPTLTHVPPETTTDYSIGYFYETGGTNPVVSGTIFNTPGTYTLYVYAINNGRFGISCIEEDSFVLTVSETPVLPSYVLFNSNYCSTFTLPDLPEGDFTVNYYWQQGGNASDIISTDDYTFTIEAGENPTSYDIWVYAEATNNPNCFDEEHFQFTLYPTSEFEIEDGIICIDAITGELVQGYLLESGLNPNSYSVEWYLDGATTPVATGLNYYAIEAGTYTAVPIMFAPQNPPNCNYDPTTVEVGISSSAIASVSVTLPFEDVAVATVIIENGIGNYIFSLDDGDFQSSPIFDNLSSGDHTITIQDTLGDCGITILEFTVVKYPKFFTPNGDGYNDTWNIWDLQQDYPDAVISIFDRYGKFLKQISPIGEGWDGTYNGHQLPSTDYWFTVDFTYYGQEKQFKAHFSMKR